LVKVQVAWARFQESLQFIRIGQARPTAVWQG